MFSVWEVYANSLTTVLESFFDETAAPPLAPLPLPRPRVVAVTGVFIGDGDGNRLLEAAESLLFDAFAVSNDETDLFFTPRVSSI